MPTAHSYHRGTYWWRNWDDPAAEREISGNKEKKWANSSAYSFAEELVSEENTILGVWCLEYLVWQSKKLVEERGILSLPAPLRGPSLPSETVDTLCMFYESDDISCVTPGKKDFVSVKKDGKRQHVQKRLVLSNLKEVHRKFKERFPHYKVGFSKFAELRPKHTLCFSRSEWYTLSVCVYNTSKCQVDVIRNADTRATNIPPLFSEDNVQPSTC